jgi:hypothetical protein
MRRVDVREYFVLFYLPHQGQVGPQILHTRG